MRPRSRGLASRSRARMSRRGRRGRAHLEQLRGGHVQVVRLPVGKLPLLRPLVHVAPHRRRQLRRERLAAARKAQHLRRGARRCALSAPPLALSRARPAGRGRLGDELTRPRARRRLSHQASPRPFPATKPPRQPPPPRPRGLARPRRPGPRLQQRLVLGGRPLGGGVQRQQPVELALGRLLRLRAWGAARTASGGGWARGAAQAQGRGVPAGGPLQRASRHRRARSAGTHPLPTLGSRTRGPRFGPGPCRPAPPLPLLPRRRPPRPGPLVGAARPTLAASASASLPAAARSASSPLVDTTFFTRCARTAMQHSASGGAEGARIAAGGGACRGVAPPPGLRCRGGPLRPHIAQGRAHMLYRATAGRGREQGGRRRPARASAHPWRSPSRRSGARASSAGR
jgi:hypothetical protein